MKILVTGANGFVGSALCREALAHGLEVIAFIRAGSDPRLLPPGVQLMTGNFTVREDALRVLHEAQPGIVFHAAAMVSNGRPDLNAALAINVEGTQTLLDVATHAEVGRWVQISSMSAHAGVRSVYGATKAAADEIVRHGPVPWTILRPSLIYGPQQRGIFDRLRTLVRRFPIIPIPGNGRTPMRPVHVDDVAKAAITAALEPMAEGRTYQLGGPEDWTFRDLVEAVGEAEGHRPTLIPVPAPLCRMGALFAELLLEQPPMSTDNLEGILSAERCEIAAAVMDLGFDPRRFLA